MSEGSLSKNDSDNDDAADDSQSPRDTTGKPRGVKRKASCHETNYEDGGTEFDDDSDGNPDTSEERQPVAQKRFDQGEDAEKAMAEITRVIKMTRNKWSKEGKVSEGSLVSDFFKEELSQQGLYRNVDLAASALHATEGTTVYVTMPAVLNTLKGRKPNVDDLRHPEKAKFMFSPGNGHGSLVDLVIGEHNTSFPSDYVCMSAADLRDAGTPIAGRKDRTSARSGLSRG